ncbi:PREDICTED: uncharacterized protein LOC18597623 [Theobroma cacao]|uniref:Uncharacterized protein LOC18597623 n=2 Tax=Theobroma cacao TaxID=3641 RepID=A0AB32V1T1_THECC|nr:PREDICTED: uncharacterized protein LOC18597623 [Theobroma cacao]EOY07327.1 Plastid transcriptionally active isoform 1 [Theobroma cacao]
MKQGLLLWSPCYLSPLSFHSLSHRIPSTKHAPQLPPISASIDSTDTQQRQQQLSARERRQLRNERRESKAGYSWREEVEERLIKKPKKRYTSWTEELNLDNLAHLGPQWWVVRVARIRGLETAEVVARSLARNFPDIEFKMYTPAVQEKKRLKNGSISIKPKPLFPGCVFLKCVLNKEIHDFIRECDGVGGFVGSKVGNTKRQINKPRPVSDDDMEAIFKQAKEEQEKADQAFQEEQEGEKTLTADKLNVEYNLDSNGVTTSILDSKPKRQSRKRYDTVANRAKSSKLVPGSMVRVVSGTFAEFLGSLEKLNRKTGKATVGFTLFGKESLVELDVKDIVLETK